MPIDIDRAIAAAKWLMAAHERRDRFAPLPPTVAPRSREEAYATQDELVALLAERLGGISGHKIALSSAAVQKLLGVDSPQAGVLLESRVLASPARVAAASFLHPIVECEIALRMAEDLPAADAPFTPEKVARAIGEVMPALEIVDDRNADYALLGRHCLDFVADNTWNEGVVLGPAIAWSPALDLASLQGRLIVNGSAAGEGKGADTMGHPLAALAWVCNHLASLGRGLLRGEVVITGSIIAPRPLAAGDRIEFRLGEGAPAVLSID